MQATTTPSVPDPVTRASQEAAIDHTEVELNAALRVALEKLDATRQLRSKVTDSGSIRRGWGLDADRQRSYARAELLLRACQCNLTEFGGGTDSDQDRLFQHIDQYIGNC